MIGSKRPTIVVLSANSGSGHTKAAEALADTLAASLPEWDVLHDNIGVYVPKPQRWVIERCWEMFSTTPVLGAIYNRLYNTLVTSSALRMLFTYFLKPASKLLFAKFSRVDVRAVIALHPAAAIAASEWRAQQAFSLYTVCTDLVVHGLHDIPFVERIFCDSRAARLLPLGKGRFDAPLSFTGLPTRVSTPGYPAAEEFDVLVTFGAKGILGCRNIQAILQCLHDKRLSAIIVCGKNERLRAKAEYLLSKYRMPSQVECYGYVHDLGPFLQRARIVIGKPGGITSGETLQLNKHIIVPDKMPGQEHYNLHALAKCGLALVCSRKNLAAVVGKVLWDLSNKSVVRLPTRPVGGVATITSIVVSDLCVHASRARTSVTRGHTESTKHVSL